MKAYAIFGGGGVKAAALAGCLASAEDCGIKFVGYGGASAGSIVALLGSAGYTGVELERILVKELALEQLLDDDGAKIDQLLEQFAEISQAFKLGGLRGGMASRSGLSKMSRFAAHIVERFRLLPRRNAQNYSKRPAPSESPKPFW